ncbi:MAG: hypothetical protein QOK29_849 [Rhodospirillaceae bacterium]|jgi:hypothetical protein|nr:hypothetical protein [Rhodospirillaceae bacterium]
MQNQLLQKIVLGFIAGVIGVLLFHQIILLVAYNLGLVPFAPYSVTATAPFGVPQFVSTAFWGGLWGIVLVLVVTRVKGGNQLWAAILFGAVLPPLVAALVVTPLKGGDMAAWLSPGRIAMALVINGAWGLGTWLFFRLGRHSLRQMGGGTAKPL